MVSVSNIFLIRLTGDAGERRPTAGTGKPGEGLSAGGTLASHGTAGDSRSQSEVVRQLTEWAAAAELWFSGGQTRNARIL